MFVVPDDKQSALPTEPEKVKINERSILPKQKTTKKNPKKCCLSSTNICKIPPNCGRFVEVYNKDQITKNIHIEQQQRFSNTKEYWITNCVVYGGKGQILVLNFSLSILLFKTNQFVVDGNIIEKEISTEQYLTDKIAADSSIRRVCAIKYPTKYNTVRLKSLFEYIEIYNDGEFKYNFRIERSTAQILIDQYKKMKHSSTELIEIAAHNKIYLFLWYITHRDNFKDLTLLFDIDYSTVFQIVESVSEWLLSIGTEYLKWPDENEAKKISTIFKEKSNIPGILGCIGMQPILITNSEKNMTNIRFESQAVVDCYKKFIDIYCNKNYPKKLFNLNTLCKSDLFQKATANLDETFPCNTFLLGDTRYPSLKWLISPYGYNESTTFTQKRFYSLHSKAYNVVEDSFKLLKTRFRRLLIFTETSSFQSADRITKCACILHNLCIDNNDTLKINYKSVANRWIYPKVSRSKKFQLMEDTTRKQQLVQDLIEKKSIW